MHPRTPSGAGLGALALALLAAGPAPAQTAPRPAPGSQLAALVTAPDPTYAVAAQPERDEGGVGLTEVRLTSQTFHGEAWKHTLLIARPRGSAPGGEALLVVSGGRSGEAAPPRAEADHVVALARASGLVVAELRQVPFQPVFGGKLEDEAIAYTFGEFFKTGDAGWPLLAPMVKSVVRAMDAVQSLTGVTGFTVTGESKRGWTTWLTAAVDRRVDALAPQVFDILNMRPQLAHQKAVWGRYSEEIGDYSGQGLPELLATPRGADLLALIDPYTMRDRLTQPKLVVLATNDHYWPVDAETLYFDALPAPKYRLHVPNEGHDVHDRRIIDADRIALALAAAGRLALPAVDGRATTAADGRVTLTLASSVRPQRLRLWQASAASQDLREATWRVAAEPAPTLAASATVAPPAGGKGVTAAFLEATYDLAGHPFTVTGPVGVSAR